MPIRSPRRAAAALLLASAAACVPPSVARPALPEARVGHVVVISIDGLRPDAIPAAPAENLLRMMEEGAHAREARTILPSRTLPSHTSMLTGVQPAVHGITWNDERVEVEGRVQVPTVFSVAGEAGVHTAAFFGKAKFRHLVLPGAPRDVEAPWGSEVVLAPRMAEQVLHYLRFRRPRLLFVHLPDPDIAGHSLGWMSTGYRWAVRRSDAAVELIRRAAVEAFDGDVVVIVTADHGGHGTDHGTDAPEDVRIPWIAWGAGVVPGEIAEPLSTTATAATALWLLGVPVPEDWEGRPVEAAFEPVPVAP
jgi:predicted AlkP superfamily pyrophosphatase or phosphodiesterase